MKGERSY